MSHAAKKQKTKTTAEDEDEADCARFFHEKIWPTLVSRRPEALLRLEYELCRTFAPIYIGGPDAELILTTKTFGVPFSAPYHAVLRDVDLEGHSHQRTSLPWHRGAELADFPLIAAASSEKGGEGGPLRRARTLHKLEMDAAVVRTSWIIGHMLYTPQAGASLPKAVEMVERAAMTLTKNAFSMRAAALALSQHMAVTERLLLLLEDRHAPASSSSKPQPLARRPRHVYRENPLLLVPLEEKSGPRLAFEDEVFRVLDWRITHSHDALMEDQGFPDAGTVLVSNGDTRLMRSAVPLERLERLLVHRGDAFEAMRGALTAARWLEEAGYALLRAAQRLRRSGTCELPQ